MYIYILIRKKPTGIIYMDQHYLKRFNLLLFFLVFGAGSNTSPSQHSKEKEKTEVTDTSVKDKDKKKELFEEWLVKKINLFKSFHIQVSTC